MKIRAYNGKVIDFPRLETVQERIDFIVENVLEDKELAKYYNPMSDIAIKELDSNEHDKIVDRWLGIKVVGKPDKMEHTKGFLDYLAGYILNAKDLSQKGNYREFYNLVYKDELNEVETKRFNELKKLVVYADMTKQGFDSSSILIRNVEFEKLMKNRIEELKKLDNDSYTHKFMINDLQDRLLMCDEIIKEIKELDVAIKKQEEVVKNKYKELKEKFNSNNRSEVVNLAINYTRHKDELRWYKTRVKDLINEYQIITELQQKIN